MIWNGLQLKKLEIISDQIINLKVLLFFAKTGGGDLWAWNIDYLPGLPVVYCPHDDDEGVFYADSLEAAIFRHILEFVSQNNFCVNKGESWENYIRRC